jgi:hypothetical protein
MAKKKIKKSRRKLYAKAKIIISDPSDSNLPQNSKSLEIDKEELTTRINTLVCDIRNAVASSDAVELLRYAFWRKNSHSTEAAKSPLGESHDYLISMRLIDYIQSLIASTPCSDTTELLNEDNFEELADKVELLFKSISCYHEHQELPKQFERSKENDLAWGFYIQVQMAKYFVRGTRFRPHIIPFFREFLLPHDEIFKNLYGVGCQDIISGLEKIQYSLTIELENIRGELQQLIKDSNCESDISLDEILLNCKNIDLKKRLINCFWGDELFNLGKITNWPISLLNDLSWAQGENTDFFAGEKSGWPYKDWPIFQKPFIKLQDKFYCFDLFCLFDNFYRVIQRIILSRAPEYRNLWTTKQTEISESVPFELFKRILPAADFFKQVYYKDEQKRWCETDGIIISDDHIFVLEVKGGQLSNECPTDNFESYVKSLKRLLESPSKQGSRFLKTLNKNKKMTLFDHAHNPVTHIQSEQFAHQTVCVITIDLICEMAAKVHQLENLGIQAGNFNVWALSIDDLRMHADIFGNPLVFLHYIEKRAKANKSSYLRLNGEIDHLALYLDCNDYYEEAERVGKRYKNVHPSRYKWVGVGMDIQKYYSDMYYSKYFPEISPAHVPAQEMHAAYKDIIDSLAKETSTHRRKAVSTLLNFSGERRNTLIQSIESQKNHKRGKVISLWGNECITVLCTIKDLSPFNMIEESQDIARAYACYHNEKERMWLHLNFSGKGKLLETHFRFFKPEDFPTDEREYYYGAGQYIVDQKTSSLGAHKKIGRNAPCPCGSGVKYKKCCGR